MLESPFTRIYSFLTPHELSNSVLADRPVKVPDDEEVRRLIGSMSDRYDDVSTLYLLQEDTFHPKLSEAEFNDLNAALSEVRRGVFEAFPAGVSLLLMEQAFARKKEEAIWRRVIAKKGPVLDLIPELDGRGLMVKQKFRDGMSSSVNVGRDSLRSPFLAPELVVRDDSFAVTLAPDRSDWRTLQNYPVVSSFITRPKLGARAVWTTMQGLAVLHEAGLAHHDVKPANIFFVEGNGILADFEDTRDSDSGVCTLGYSEKTYSAGKMAQDFRATDIFSLGMTLATVLKADPAWAAGFAEIHSEVSVNGFRDALMASLRRDNVAEKPLQLILNMTNLEGEERPSIQDCIQQLGRIYDLGEPQL